MRKPRLISPCVADRYSGPGERRAEFSFPDHVGREAAPWLAASAIPGGLLLLKDRGPDLPPLVELYRVEGCEVRGTMSDAQRAVNDAALAVADSEGGDLIEAVAGLRKALAALNPSEA